MISLYFLSILSHLLVTLLSATVFIISFLITIKTKKIVGKVSAHWVFFNWGVLIIFFSEIIDIFTPIFEAPLGGPNVFSESIEVVGLSFLFLAIYKFASDFSKV